MKKVARILRGHRDLLSDRYRARKMSSSGAVEGLNVKAEVTTRNACGLKGCETLGLAFYRGLVALPHPRLSADSPGEADSVYTLRDVRCAISPPNSQSTCTNKARNS